MSSELPSQSSTKPLKVKLFTLLTIALLVLLVVAIFTAHFYNSQYTLSNRYYDIKVVSQDILYYDEVLTMSTMVGIHSADRQWYERYQQNARLLDNALDRAAKLDPSVSKFISETSEANTVLVDLEERAFVLGRNGDVEQALALIFSDQYQQGKEQFAQGIGQALNSVLKDTEIALDKSRQKRGTYLLAIMILSFVMVLGLWFYLVSYIRTTDSLMEELLIEDALTGLFNRRKFNFALAHEINRAYRNNAHVMLAILDIDHFKKYNDEYGHPQGDNVICQVGNVLKHNSRRSADSAYRIGGEEFALISTTDDKNLAVQQIENVIQEVRDLGIPHTQNGAHQRVTVSCGVAFATYDAKLTDEHLYHLADEALYKAKQSGRNCHVVFGD